LVAHCSFGFFIPKYLVIEMEKEFDRDEARHLVSKIVYIRDEINKLKAESAKHREILGEMLSGYETVELDNATIRFKRYSKLNAQKIYRDFNLSVSDDYRIITDRKMFISPKRDKKVDG